MRLFYLLPVAALTAGLGGCGWLQNPDYGPIRDRHHDYVKAETQPQMQLASGQTSKPLSPLYPIPPAQSDKQASLFIPPRPAPAPMLATEVFVVQETAWQSWILAQREPAQVWPLAQAFFISRGFAIEDARAEQGLFVARHKTGSSVDNGSGASLDYLVRIQPGLEDKTAELMLEYSRDGAPFSANNLQLVNGALNPLQQYMLSASERGDSYSLLASYNQRGPQERVENLGGNLILRVQADMEQAWPAVGRALQNSGFYVRAQSQKQAIYVLDLEREVQTTKRSFLSKFNTLLKDVHQRIEDEKRQERDEALLAAGKTPVAPVELEIMVDERYHQLRMREQEGLIVLSLEDSEQQPAESNLASSVLNRLREQLNREDFAQVETASQQHLFVERLVQLEQLGDSWQLRLQGKSKARAWQDLDRVLQSEDFVRIDELAAEAVFVISIREQQWRREADSPMSLSSIYQRIEAEKRLEREREQQARKNRKEKPKEIAKYRLAVQSDVGDSLLLIQNEDGSAATSDEAMQIMQRIQQLLD